MAALYPSIPHEDELETLRKRLVESEDFQLVNDIIKMAESGLKNNIFAFNSKVKQQVVGTAIGTINCPPPLCLYLQGWEKDRIFKDKNYSRLYDFDITNRYTYGILLQC